MRAFTPNLFRGIQFSGINFVEDLSSNDDSVIMLALQTLCEQLNMSSVLPLFRLNLPALIPKIVDCLQRQGFEDMNLLAARVLTYMADSFTPSLAPLSEAKNVQALLWHLENTEDMELAEQCLACLEKLCGYGPGAVSVLLNNGIAAMHAFTDFFTINSQRKIWANTAKVASFVRPETFHFVKKMLCTLQSGIMNEDPQICSSAISTITSIIRGLHSAPELVNETFGDIINEITVLLNKNEKKDFSFVPSLTLLHVALSSSDEVVLKVLSHEECVTTLHSLLSCANASPFSSFSTHTESFSSGVASPTECAFSSETEESAGSSPASFQHGRAQSAALSTEESRLISSIWMSFLPSVNEENMNHLDSLREKEFSTAEEAEQKWSWSMEEFDDNDIEIEDEDESSSEENEVPNAAETFDGYFESSSASASERLSFAESEEHQNNQSFDHEAMRRKIQEANISLDSSPNRHLKDLMYSSSLCDGCNCHLDISDWYHCTECVSFDFCSKCLLARYRTHEEGRHLFVDVSEVNKNITEEDVAIARSLNLKMRNLFENQPALLEKVLRAVPEMVQLCCETETPLIRYFCLDFLSRAMYYANPSQLKSCGVTEASICETISLSLNSPILLSYLGIFLAKQLLIKLPGVYLNLLVREGIVRKLQKISAQRSDTKGKAEEAFSKEWWLNSLAQSAKEIFDRFEFPKNLDESQQLETVKQLFRSKKTGMGFFALREAILAGPTTYELFSSNVVHCLVKELVKHKSIVAIVALVHILSLPVAQDRGSAGLTSSVSSSKSKGDTPLLLLIRYLHRLLTYADKFESPSFGGVQNAHSNVTIQLIREEKDPSGDDETAVAGEEASSEDEETESGEIPQISPDGIVVAVEPLAEVSAIQTFISQKLLMLQTLEMESTQSLPDVDEEVRETIPNVWLRIGEKALPSSLTMVQIVEAVAEEKVTQDAGHRKIKRVRGQKPVVLHYQTTPYDTEKYPFLSVVPEPPQMNFNEVKLIRPSEDYFPPMAGFVLRSLECNFPWSNRFLQSFQKEVLTLLGVLFEVTSRWMSIIPYIQDDVEKFLEPIKSLPSGSKDFYNIPLSVKSSDFCHQKLNNKAMRHCSNFLLAGQHLRVWAVNLALDCGFLFFPSTRKFMFDVSFCSSTRSFVRMNHTIEENGILDRESVNNTMRRAFRLRHVQKRVWRDAQLEYAHKTFGGNQTSYSVVWDFQFFGEEGLGLGPTKEFYTLVAEALQKPSLRLWRASDGAFEAPFGLFPRLYGNGSPCDGEEIEKHFFLLGRFLSRALLDGHVPSMYLSPSLLHLLRGDSCTVSDLQWVDPSIYQVVVALLEAEYRSVNTVKLLGQKNCFDVDDLCLDFSIDGIDLLPHDPNIGEDRRVTRKNVMEYCDALVDMILCSGVEKSVLALRKGFSDNIPLFSLRILTIEELQHILKGFDRRVTRKELMENCLADHGFTLSCQAVQWFFDILSSFSLQDQQTFFLFLTGCDHLPIGGLASLQPKLTIVRKTSSESNIKESDQLPSAMTCQNYFKLPAYETKEQMEAKIRLAMEEGKGSFHLT